MADDQQRKWLPIGLIAGALAVWGALLALGAYWAPVGAAAGADRRKLLVVAATTGGFLLFWGAVLLVRTAGVRRRQKRAGHPTGNDLGSPPPG